MALKGERIILEDDITYTCPTATERGVGLVVKTGGSGVSLGSSAGVADLVADPSGSAVAGILVNDVVDIDQTRYHRNFHKDETIIKERVRLVRKGRLTTNKVSGTPKDGDNAYLTTSGQFTPTLSATGGLVATPKVGRFKSAKDENGFATIDFNIPA